MSKALTWDNIGERLYQTGVSKAVLYPYDSTAADAAKAYKPGVAWNGITAFTESPSGAEASKLYADNAIYATLYSTEEFGATLEAYMYPDEFEACDGTASLEKGVTIGQQARKAFGLCYRTEIGNDVEGEEFGYKLHLVYGCKASPSEKSHATINDSPEAETLSWEITTTPIEVEGFKKTATLDIDSTKVTAKAMAAIEKVLYGSETEDAYLPLPAEVIEIIKAAGTEG